jgi:TRAP-type C4-dicarboxylate transport system permease small subunit
VVLAALLIIAIGAFHIAQMRVVNHYDVQMLPVLKRLNIITVALLSGMVFFATFAIN